MPPADEGRTDAGSDMTRSSPYRRILIVDGYADNADIMASLLKLSSHQIEVARSGPEGLAFALATRREVILLDIGLPGLDGFEVASRLRATGEFDGVLIIAITGYGRES